MKVIAWKYGFRIWLSEFVSIAVLGPRNPRLFSERNGYHRPLLKFGLWRLFIDREVV
jgi:hypothetical protein